MLPLRPGNGRSGAEGRAVTLSRLPSHALRRLATRARSLLRDTASGEDLLFYWLHSPRYEAWASKRSHHLSGWCLWYGERLVTELAVTVDAAAPVIVGVRARREEIARTVRGAAGADRCGFAADIELPADAGRLAITTRFSDGGSEPLLAIDLDGLRGRAGELERLARAVDALPLPDPELVFLTQGLRDPEFYRATIVPAALNTSDYLAAAGFDLRSLATLLDFGCGSGRLLAGWHVLDATRALSGCDINGELIEWARANLPASLDLRVTGPQPPLPYPDRAFDVVFAVSVFTHLSEASQRRWADELSRVVRPGGALLVTLHGASYLPHIFPGRPERLDDLLRAGHLVTEVGTEGSNQFASVHTRGFARRLFADFDLAGFFPNGRLAGRRLPYPVFILQDVYVLRRRA